MSVYKIFISNDLILFNIYIINIVFASKRLYTSLKQNIVTFPMALPSGYPMSPLMGLQHPTDPQLCFISPILAKRRIFFLLGQCLGSLFKLLTQDMKLTRQILSRYKERSIYQVVCK